MKNAFKLFDFMGTPVYLKYWFFLFLLFGINTFVTFFIAVLVHELAHTYVAKKFNLPVSSVVLDFLFGSAGIDTNYTPYGQTILISIAGPLSNLLLSGLGWLLLNNGGADTFLASFLLTFTSYNFILFIFNILPIYPMDGGRISKAICQWVTKPTIGRKINGVISIISSILLLVFSIYSEMYIMAIFCLLFIYMGYTEIEQKY
jgi:Zn-dependent protease